MMYNVINYPTPHYMDPKNKLGANGEVPLKGAAKKPEGQIKPSDIGTDPVKKDIAHVLESDEKPLTLNDLLEGYPVQVSDYDHVCEKFEHVARMLGIEEKVTADETTKRYVEETGNKRHYMARLRQQEIALETLLPLIAQIPPVKKEDLWKSGERPGRTEKMMYISYVALLLATGVGSKSWPIDCFVFLAMEGEEKARTIKAIFAKNKLQSFTLYERQTGKNTFATYEANSGDMNQIQFEAAVAYAPSADELKRAEATIVKQMKAFGTDVSLEDFLTGQKKMDTKVVEAAAKIRYGSKHPNADRDSWLLAEAMIFAGRP